MGQAETPERALARDRYPRAFLSPVTTMSIIRKRYGRSRPRQGLGDTLSSIIGVIGTSVDVAQDPYLSEFACRLEQLHAINIGQAPGACTTTAPNLGGGVGLRKLMPAIRGYVYAEEHPWAYVVGALVVIGLPMAIGYSLGKGR